MSANQFTKEEHAEIVRTITVELARLDSGIQILRDRPFKARLLEKYKEQRTTLLSALGKLKTKPRANKTKLT